MSGRPDGRRVDIEPHSPMKSIMKRFLLLLVAVGFMALVGAGCQTTKGLGRDVENLGENIQGN